MFSSSPATRTNAENHPRILPLGSSIAGGSTTSNRPVSIAASSYLAGSIAGSRLTSSGAERMPKVKVDPRTGLTQIVGWEKSQKRRDNGEGSVVGDKVENVENEDEDGEVDYDSDVTEGEQNDRWNLEIESRIAFELKLTPYSSSLSYQVLEM